MRTSVKIESSNKEKPRRVIIASVLLPERLTEQSLSYIMSQTINIPNDVNQEKIE